jgi:C4-dicarboxylate-specific signal transduction histidine kinase
VAATGATPRPVALAEAVRQALATARARCPAHVLLTEQVPADLWALAEDEMLHQVVVNLVVNGAQAVPDGRPGKVEVRAEQQGERVVLTVEDDGAGMPPDVLRRVFEPFFTTRPFGTGTGLGLAFSRGLIAGLGGELRLDSAVGRGTRAVIALPRAAAASGAEPTVSGK